MTDYIPYGRQYIDDDDIAEVVETLKSDWLTTGPGVELFEKAVCEYSGAEHGAAVSSGTAALHALMHAVGIGEGDEVIIPTMTFAATANAVLYCGGTPVFTDVNVDTLLIDIRQVEDRITNRTKAIIAMDYGGQTADYDKLRKITDRHGLILLADACHSLGAEYKERMSGTLADASVFSFHPVKHITTGEGGMVVTNNAEYADKVRIFRNHGISSDHWKRQSAGTWYYEMTELGMNYRLNDIQCALGRSQMRKLPRFLKRRREIAAMYDAYFKGNEQIHPLKVGIGCSPSYHLYVIELFLQGMGIDRQEVFTRLRNAGIGVNVHYLPVHLHPYYQQRFGTCRGMFPAAEDAYERIISLPIYPGMDDGMVDRVCNEICKAVKPELEYRRRRIFKPPKFIYEDRWRVFGQVTAPITE